MNFSDLLTDVLGYADAECISVSAASPGSEFRSVVVPWAEAPQIVSSLGAAVAIYHGVNPVVCGGGAGRGGVDEVTRLAAAVVDLDVKPGGCADVKVARSILAGISALIGAPSAVVRSGGGLHGYWAISDGHINTIDDRTRMVSVLKRFGDLCRRVARDHDADIDSVFDLSRVMRTPGSFNIKKNPPEVVVAEQSPGSPLTVGELEDLLDGLGVAAPAPKTVTTNPAQAWSTAPAESDCDYATQARLGWREDVPTKGRHQWLLAQMTRVAAMSRRGCLTESGLAASLEAVESRFRELCSDRAVPDSEVPDAIKWGRDLVAEMTEAEVDSELGGHIHDFEAIANDFSGLLIGVPTASAIQSEPEDEGQPEAARPEITLTDSGAADLLAYQHRGSLRFCPEMGKWLTFDGCTWIPRADDSAAYQAARATVDSIPAGEPGALATFKKKCLAANKLSAMVGLARRSPALQVSIEDLDSTPHLLNTKSGVVDLRTGSINTGATGMHTLCTSVGYDPVAASPRWNAFLSETFGGDQEMVAYIRRLAGLSVIGEVREHVLPFLHGSGANGKALDRTTPILTADRGWVQLGDIVVGDGVYHPDGTTTSVTGAFETFYNHRCYEVTTTDDRSIVADSEHLWTVRDVRRKDGEWETITTRQLLGRGVANYRGELAYRMPEQKAIQSPNVEGLPIPPYLLGVWLGDGTSRSAVCTFGDQDVIELCGLMEAHGARIVSRTQPHGRTAWTVRFNITGARKGDGFGSLIKDNNLYRNKHIPESYLTAGTQQRLELLRGLMDTDGYISRGQGQCEYVTVVRELGEQVLLLARSLGYRATVKEHKALLNGVDYGPKYRVMFTPNADQPNPFSLTRRAELVRPTARRVPTSIRSIAEVATRPVRCIKVDREDGLFLAGRDLMPTHNTVLSDVLQGILGTYAIVAPQNFLLSGRDKHETEIARLRGARLVVASEVSPGSKFDEAKIKILTGGDSLTGRFMRGDFFDFVPSHTVWLAGNHQPTVEAGGYSFWRRLRLIPFNFTVPEHRRISGLDKLLIAEEGPAILAWIVQGAVDVLRFGLVDPPSVLAATEEYMRQEDQLQRFADDCLLLDLGDSDCVPTRELNATYRRWCLDNNEDELPERQFGRELTARFGLGLVKGPRGVRMRNRVGLRETTPNWLMDGRAV